MTRAFEYQPHQQFLTEASGPWPGPLTWTYDRIGNRLSEVRAGGGGYSDTYAYLLNGESGNTAVLDAVSRGGGPLRDYAFDLGGFLDSVDASGNLVDFSFDAAGHLGQTSRMAGAEQLLDYRYDGRGFLSEAFTPVVNGSPPCPSPTDALFCDGYESSDFSCWSDILGGSPGGQCPWHGIQDTIEPTYTSEGWLFGFNRSESGASEQRAVLYLGQRPVAIWSKVGTNPAAITYLTTDHLGTPILATNSAGATIWSGGFEPFGRDWQEGTANDTLAKGIFLRLPGQWDDTILEASTLGAEQFYNVHRWLEPQSGRYSSVDPLWGRSEPYAYVYARLNPLRYSDPLGLDTVGCDGVPGVAEKKCVLECCAQHDKCFDDFNCTSKSWTAPEKGCNAGDCKKCNDDVIRCIRKRCLWWDRDDPARPNYYCAALHRFVEIPGDFPDRKSAEAACEHDHGDDCDATAGTGGCGTNPGT